MEWDKYVLSPKAALFQNLVPGSLLHQPALCNILKMQIPRPVSSTDAYQSQKSIFLRPLGGVDI